MKIQDFIAMVKSEVLEGCKKSGVIPPKEIQFRIAISGDTQVFERDKTDPVSLIQFKCELPTPSMLNT